MIKVIMAEIPEEEKAEARATILDTLDDVAFMISSYMTMMEQDEEKKQRFSDLIEETYLNSLSRYNNMTPEQLYIKMEIDVMQMMMERIEDGKEIG